MYTKRGPTYECIRFLNLEWPGFAEIDAVVFTVEVSIDLELC
eukprot:SAG11_NODE_84_length_17377_cov_78.572578_2_plen_42_part_00